MGFEVTQHAPTNEPMVEVHERLCLTEDGRLVDESDPAARWLYCLPGHKVPLSEAQRYGLVTPEPEPKQSRPPANKMRAKPAADKGS